MSTNATSIRSLIRTVVCRLPQFVAKGRMIYLLPVGTLLRGVVFDSSAFSATDFDPTVFVQPLYLPKTYISYTFGGRLRAADGRAFDLGENERIMDDVLSAITGQALPFLNRIQTPTELAVACDEPRRFSEQFTWREDDINVLEVAAYSWLLANQDCKARHKLDQIDMRVRLGNDDRDWILELGERARRMSRLIRLDRIAAIAQLTEWSSSSARSLGLKSL